MTTRRRTAMAVAIVLTAFGTTTPPSPEATAASPPLEVTHVVVNTNGKAILTGDGHSQLTLFRDAGTDEYVVKNLSSTGALVLDDDAVCHQPNANVVRCPEEAISAYTVVFVGTLNSVTVNPSWNLAGRIYLGSGGESIAILSGNRWTKVTGGASSEDQVSFILSRHPVTVSLDGIHNDGITGNPKVNVAANVESITGSQFNDVLLGSGLRNYISGIGGDDQIYGFGRSDNLAGGDGTDVVDGGDQIDYCYAESELNCER